MKQHRYLPMTEQDQKEMLDVIGISSIDELFADIPEKVRFKGEYNIKPAKAESALLKELSQLAAKNADSRQYASFLGAGVYDHFKPIIVDHVISRSEFYTAYTPYQPEISQGELQAILQNAKNISKNSEQVVKDMQIAEQISNYSKGELASVTKATEKQTTSMEEIVATAESLEKIAEDLLLEVQQFRM